MSGTITPTATDAPLQAGLLSSFFDEAAARFSNAPAIDFLGRHFSYREIAELVDRAAVGLQSLGVEKGTRVGLFLPNTPYSVIAFFAVLKVGGVVVNYNPLYAEPEVRHQVQDSGTRVMFVLDLADHYNKVAAQLGNGTLQHIIVCPLGRAMPGLKGAAFTLLKRKTLIKAKPDAQNSVFAALVAQGGSPKPVALDPSAPAVLQYTGGTTGVPKAAVLTHSNLTIQVQQLVRWIPEYTPGSERVLGILPLFHVFAMTVVMLVGIACGAEMLLLPRLDLDMLMKTVTRRRPTMAPGVPTLYTAIANAADKTKGVDLSSIRICLSGGAPLPDEVRVRFEKLTGCVLVEGYGLSEASPVVTINPPGTAGKPGSVGLPVAGTVIEIRSIDDPNKLMPQGESGEVCIRGPQVMAGYWNRPDETARVMIDGALRTGDVGYIDADGYLFLVDRLKDLIICSGFNVYPRTIEEALYRHPAVAEAAVIGIPDQYRGEAPKAFVQLRAGMTATPEEIMTFLQGHISKIEIPREIEIRDSLPKSTVGKILRRSLADEEKQRAKAKAERAA
ncbi:MAG TPA: long-chain fatty acid--CoA ligase [Magnetospirillaceae bacterium]|jgi:long-chain acyl-CoA synthetase